MANIRVDSRNSSLQVSKIKYLGKLIFFSLIKFKAKAKIVK